MHRVLVIGGRGFLGRRVVDGLRRQPELEVVAGARAGDVRVDLAVPDSFAAMEPFDTVVDCADSVAAPPDEALAWCVGRGKIFLEASAEPRTIERLLAAAPAGPGLAVVGVGLFPGVSNLLARSVWQQAGGRGPLAVGVRIRPLSGAGAGTRRLMTELLGAPALAWRGGQPVELAPLSTGPVLPFGGRRRQTLAVRLAEPPMLRASTGADDVAAYLAAAPSFMAPLMRLAAGGPRRRRLLGPLMRAGLALIRGGLLRWRAAPIELAAAAGDRRAALVTRDGFAATGSAVAAAVALLAGHPARRTGTATPDQVFELDEYLARMQLIDPESAPRIG